MIRHQPHPDGEHWRVVFATNDPAGPFRLQRGSWVTGYGPDTGRVTRIFAATLESSHPTSDAAYAAVPPGAVVDRFDAAELVKSLGISV